MMRLCAESFLVRWFNFTAFASYVILIFNLATIPTPASAEPVKDAGQRRPNFVIIMADDLGYGDIGCYGSRRHSTLHIDALAKSGMRFTDYHSNGAVCSPRERPC